jgi:putative hydroxymethylpyrimidine transport system permease protein
MSSRRTINRVAAAVLNCWPFVLLVALWQFYVVTSNASAIIAVPPSAVVEQMLSPNWMLESLASTLKTTFLGLTLGMAMGILLSVAAWWSRVLGAVVTPSAMMLRTAPIVAFIPAIAAIVGYNNNTVLVVAGVFSFFPTFVFTAAGLAKTPPGSRDLLQVLGATRFQYLVRLALPSAVPGILLSLRISASGAVLGALAAEFLVGPTGLGSLLRATQFNVETDRSWAIGLVVAVVSLTSYQLATLAERVIGNRFLI